MPLVCVLMLGMGIVGVNSCTSYGDPIGLECHDHEDHDH